MSSDSQETNTFESVYSTGKDPESASQVRSLYWEAVQGIRSELRDYWLNHAFLHGHQWIFWSEVDGRLDDIPSDPDRVQATINRIWPNTRTIISTLMSRELQFEVPPNAADDAHIRGARLAETIARAVHNDHNWEQMREQLYYAVWKGGTAAVCVDWDEDANEILSDDTQGSPLNEGDTYEQHLNITQFVVEPGTIYPEEARWWIKTVALPPEEVEGMFDLERTPPSDATASLAPFHRKLMAYDRGGDSELTDLTLVMTYYERPNPKTPEGKVCTVVDQQVVFEDVWPFPFKDRLNLVVLTETPRENRWTGDTVLSAARPIQTLLNVAWSSVVEHMKQAGNARLLIPMSSIEIMNQASDMAGELLPYNDSLPVKPAYLSPPQMPGWWIDMPDRLAAQMDDIMGVHDISRGSAPANIESGFGLTILAEKDTTPVTRLARETSRAFGRLMSMVLAIYEDKTKSKSVTRRSLVRVPGNAPLTVVWNGKDLKGQTTAFVPYDAVVPRSRASSLEMAKDMLQAQLITTLPEFVAVADLAGGRDVLAATSPDVDQARRENSQFGLGRQSIPRQWHDHKLHISEHNAYRKTVDFEMLDEEEKQMIADHIQAHATLGAEEIGDSRARSNIDPALAAAPTPAEGPVVAPLPPAGVPGQVGLPAVANEALEGMGEAGPTPEGAASDIMSLMSQMGS